MDNNKLPKAAYNMLFTLHQNGKENWVTKVKNLLFKYGFGVAFISQEVGNPKVFIELFKQRIKDLMRYELITASIF